MSIRDLPRGEDLERDKRLDQYYGHIEFGVELFKPAPQGGTLLGRRIRKIGYDGTVLKTEDIYNTRLYWD